MEITLVIGIKVAMNTAMFCIFCASKTLIDVRAVKSMCTGSCDKSITFEITQNTQIDIDFLIVSCR